MMIRHTTVHRMYRRAGALRWYLEVRSLIIALVIACVIGVTVTVLLAAWLIRL
jgi:hypothetical protein